MSEDQVRQQTLAVVHAYMALLAQGRWNEWGALWSDDSVLEFPFAPAGVVNRHVGREAILAYMEGTAGTIRVNGVRAVAFHPLLDPTAMIVELQIDGTMASTGAAYNQRYVTFFKLSDGRIATYREYWNPLVTIAASGGYDSYMKAFYAKSGAGD